MDIPRHSIVIGKQRTSLSLEQGFWDALREIAKGHGKSMTAVVNGIFAHRTRKNLSAEVRLFVLDYYRCQSRGQKLDSRTAQILGIENDPSSDRPVLMTLRH